ncbi:MAG: L-2-hydroxyglutarate oxidase [Solirubrobacteraceae bacterium]
MAGDADGDHDVAVVGAGVVGLAVAREALRRRPESSVVVVEREPEVAAHQSSHNSGVVHAGIYYEPGSLKARLCVQGARELFEYCEARDVPIARPGKVIVATRATELPGLDELERRGRANGVPGLRRIEPSELTELEPHVRGLAALHSPATGLVDFAAVARALAEDVRAGGGKVVTGAEVERVDARSGDAQVATMARAEGAPRARADVTIGLAGGAEIRARRAVLCAGAWSDRLAEAAGADPDPRVVPFRGAYMRLRPERRELVRGLVYPVPDPALPFLGVHLTRHADGEVLVGPTALLAGARDAYRMGRIRPRDLAATLAWPGTWRMGRRWWRTGLREIHHAARPSALAAEAARFVPELRGEDLEPAFAGVRAQALARDGRVIDDFVFTETEGALHVRNAPSPAATASLAIAREIVDRLGWAGR